MDTSIDHDHIAADDDYDAWKVQNKKQHGTRVFVLSPFP